MRRLVLTTLLLAAGSASANTLQAEIEAADAALFSAFNNRDIKTLDNFFSDRLEFFHDKGGLSEKAQTMRQFAEMFARDGVRIRRELVAGSVAVYPVPGVGAMQVGRHLFCAREGDAPEGCSEYGFSQVWEQTADGWKLLRVLSYGH